MGNRPEGSKQRLWETDQKQQKEKGSGETGNRNTSQNIWSNESPTKVKELNRSQLVQRQIERLTGFCEIAKYGFCKIKKSGFYEIKKSGFCEINIFDNIYIIWILRKI